VFLVILGSNPALFSFFVVTSPLRESVRVLAIAPHLLNVRVQTEARFGADSLEPIVGCIVIPKLDFQCKGERCWLQGRQGWKSGSSDHWHPS
jgi:hypothetical protein